MGRYHYYRLHPFSLGEVAGTELDSEERLFRFGGFPEPLIAASDRVWRRWQRERLQRVIREDLITLERVNEISQLTLLADALPSRVGSPLSMKSLAEDLQVSQPTVKC